MFESCGLGTPRPMVGRSGPTMACLLPCTLAYSLHILIVFILVLSWEDGGYSLPFLHREWHTLSTIFFTRLYKINSSQKLNSNPLTYLFVAYYYHNDFIIIVYNVNPSHFSKKKKKLLWPWLYDLWQLMQFVVS